MGSWDDVAEAPPDRYDSDDRDERNEWLIRLPDGSWLKPGSKAARYVAGGSIGQVGGEPTVVFVDFGDAIDGASALKTAADEVGAEGYSPTVWKRQRVIEYTYPEVDSEGRKILG